VSTALELVNDDIVSCTRCPRLVAWTQKMAKEKRASYADQEYWGRPVMGFGDPAARIGIVGLAPAAHGANRTGRMFTGDRSGDWLYRGLYVAGMANQAEAVALDDGLILRDAWVTSAVKCAPPDNKPTAQEQNRPRAEHVSRATDTRTRRVTQFACAGRTGGYRRISGR